MYLQGEKMKRKIHEIFQAALDAIKPNTLVERALHCAGDVLTVSNRNYKLKNNVHVVGFGKAVYGMISFILHNTLYYYMIHIFIESLSFLEEIFIPQIIA